MTIHFRALAGALARDAFARALAGVSAPALAGAFAPALAGAFAFAGLAWSGSAFASCTASPTNPALTAAQISTLLTGNTVCAARGNERWQELHQANGDVIDFKRGPGHPVDPSEKVGTWSATGGSGNPRVNYTYSPGNGFSYQVFANGGTSYSFCSSGTELLVTVKPGGGACP